MPETMVEDLPIGQQQLVEIAKAISLNARILISGRADIGAFGSRSRHPSSR